MAGGQFRCSRASKPPSRPARWSRSSAARASASRRFLHVLGTLDLPTSGHIRFDGRRSPRLPRRRARRLPQPHDRLRLPVPPPAARVHRARERAPCPALIAGRAASSADRPRRRAARARRARAIGSPTAPASCRAASSSAWRWRARWSCAPRLLLADEPTGNLDAQTGEEIHELFVELNRERGMTLLVVTHNPDLAARMPRRLRMVDGIIARRGGAADAVSRGPGIATCVARSSALCSMLSFAAGALPSRRAPACARRGARPRAADRRLRSASAATARSRTTPSARSSLTTAGRQARPRRSCATTCARSGRWATSRTSRSRPRRHGAAIGAHLRGAGEARDPQDLRPPATRSSALDKINEVLDLKKDTILDLAKVKKNVEKIRDLYVEKGFYLADVDVRGAAHGSTDQGRRLLHRRRARQGRGAPGPLPRQQARSPTTELQGAIGTQEGGWLSFLTSSGTYREDAFERDLLLLTAFYYDHGYINVKLGKPEIELSPDKRYLYITIPIDEGPPYNIGKIDFKGDLLKPKDDYFKLTAGQAGRDVQSLPAWAPTSSELNDIYKDEGYAYVNISRSPTSTRRSAPSTSPSKCRRASWSTSSASTSAATPRPATR